MSRPQQLRKTRVKPEKVQIGLLTPELLQKYPVVQPEKEYLKDDITKLSEALAEAKLMVEKEARAQQKNDARWNRGPKGNEPLIRYCEANLVTGLLNYKKPPPPYLSSNPFWCFLLCITRNGYYYLISQDLVKLIYVHYVQMQYDGFADTHPISNLVAQQKWLHTHIRPQSLAYPPFSGIRCLDPLCFESADYMNGISKLSYEAWADQHFRTVHGGVSFYTFLSKHKNCSHKTSVLKSSRVSCLLCGKLQMDERKHDGL